ncbi:3'-5' exonuclease [Salmonella enterica]|nr:3'-5' exonuclease [Salmonella enterica]EBN7382849.1 3'-5' exonuclease [Salmonella enterica]EBR7475298.1 3'-5' exonuclease [Salmonella enterica]EIZ6823602.1 3'-5' exonuclease [Salmonella enterica]EKH9091434.1 3'-5' exonuclease [Salmonella enterica]
MFNTQKKILSIIMEKWINGSYVILDTETTGLKVDDEIIEIAIINMRGDVLLNTLVKPVNPIPPEATKINNITNEMVASAPVWRDVFPLVKDIISNYKWLAWNSGFDARMMVQTCEKAGVFAGMTPLSISSIATAIHTSHIDAKATYDQWYGEFDSKRNNFKRQSLATVAERHNVSVKGAHRALADCLMVLGVLNTVCQLQDSRETAG